MLDTSAAVIHDPRVSGEYRRGPAIECASAFDAVRRALAVRRATATAVVEPEERQSRVRVGIDNRIMRLRRKVEADPRNPQAIRSVRGVGYPAVVVTKRGARDDEDP